MESVQCRDYHGKGWNSSTICNFMNTTDNCQIDGGFVNYLVLTFCSFDADTRWLAVTLEVWTIILLSLLWLLISTRRTLQICFLLHFSGHMALFPLHRPRRHCWYFVSVVYLRSLALIMRLLKTLFAFCLKLLSVAACHGRQLETVTKHSRRYVSRVR